MAIGVMISGIVSGLFAVIWTLIVGAPVLVVLFAYPVGGMAGVHNCWANGLLSGRVAVGRVCSY